MKFMDLGTRQTRNDAAVGGYIYRASLGKVEDTGIPRRGEVGEVFYECSHQQPPVRNIVEGPG